MYPEKHFTPPSLHSGARRLKVRSPNGMTPRSFFLCALGVAVSLAPIFSAHAAEKNLPAPTHSASELRTQISSYIEQPRFAAALWGVEIRSLDRGVTLFSYHADRRQSPASNSKLYSTALALDRFGSDYRIITPLLGTGPVDAAGVLQGDLIVSGRGDPSWDSRRDKKDFWAVFEPFATALTKAGVKQIAGGIVGDTTYFRMTPQGASWTADDLNDYYGAEISALTLDDNYVDLRISAGATVGAAASVELLQPCAEIEIDNRVTTIAREGTRRVRVVRLPGENRVHLFGELPLGGKDELTEATVPRPAQWFVASLREALIRRGIKVTGPARSVRWPDASPVPANAVPLGEITSPPLRELVAGVLKPSQNLECDLLFAHVGEARRTSSTPAWRQSDELGVEALQEFLRRNSLRPDDVIFDEGSGLSRNNLTTAAASVRLLEFMAAHHARDAFAAALPIAGVDGTLKKQMKGTAAEGNVHAKTGSLRWANALSGYVTSAAGEHLVFSLMLNRNTPPAGRGGTEELAEIAVMLARYDGKD